jgi:chemotaxis regulatin CheY-phosphate phosphatase CheZ
MPASGEPPPGYMPSTPDPTQLTQDAVDRASNTFRREIAFVRDLLSTRLDAMSETSDQRLSALTGSLHQESNERSLTVAALRTVLEARLVDLEKVADRRFAAAEQVPGQIKAELSSQITGLREVISTRLEGMDKATELRAGETLQAVATAAADRDLLRDEMLAKAQALRELVTQRLDMMDTAARVLAASVEKVPTDVDRAAGSLREVLMGEIKRVQSVTEEKFTAIDGTFSSNALALTAALSAAKEAVSEQNKTNSQAIAKSETATKEQLASLSRVTDAGIAGLEDKIADARDRLTKIESLTRGIDQAGETNRSNRNEQRAETVQQHSSTQLVIAGIAGLLSMIAIVVTIILATRHGGLAARRPSSQGSVDRGLGRLSPGVQISECPADLSCACLFLQDPGPGCVIEQDYRRRYDADVIAESEQGEPSDASRPAGQGQHPHVGIRPGGHRGDVLRLAVHDGRAGRGRPPLQHGPVENGAQPEGPAGTGDAPLPGPGDCGGIANLGRQHHGDVLHGGGCRLSVLRGHQRRRDRVRTPGIGGDRSVPVGAGTSGTGITAGPLCKCADRRRSLAVSAVRIEKHMHIPECHPRPHPLDPADLGHRPACFLRGGRTGHARILACPPELSSEPGIHDGRLAFSHGRFS